MTTKLQKRLFTVKDYKRTSEAGIFQDNERLESIRGEIV